MDELSSTNLQVVLSIKSGKGFEQVLEPTMLLATLNGHALQTNIVEPNASPQYATDLVWEIEKYALRKMRSGQAPLKLECFALKDRNNKERIGYVLLSLRSGQIVPRNKNINVKVNWHRLLGLRNDIKAQKPELFLALTIEDREPVAPSPTELENMQSFNYNTSQYGTLVPSLLDEERLIQLGPLEYCHDIFLLNITASCATNLELLLPQNSDRDVINNLNFWYRILENDVKLKPFEKSSDKIWILNEKIVVRIRSSLNVLKNYLSWKPYLWVFLKHKDNIIGQSQIDLRPLISMDNIQEFCRSNESISTLLDHQCLLNKIDPNDCNGTEHNQSYLDLQLKLQYAGSKTNLAIHESDTLINTGNYTMSSSIFNCKEDFKTNSEQKFTEIALHRNPGGDFEKCVNGMPCVLNCSNEHRNVNTRSASCEIVKNQDNIMTCSHSADTIQYQDYSKSVEAYHCFCLNISLVGIKLSPSKNIRNIEFRFHHPKAEILSTLYPKMPISSSEKVKLQDIGCKLHFISATDEIKHLLLTFPPKISVYDAGGEIKTCISQSTLSVKQLFLQNKVKNKFECQYEIPLIDMDQNKVGELDVALNLQDHGPYYRTKKRISNENLGPPILDDSLAYKIVDELETWKERQKEIFKVELKKKEERHLNLLSEEWQKHKESLESKLACSVEQCKMLANSLNNATEDLRTRRLKSLEKEARLIKANEDLQWRYDAKVQELKELLRVMQEELTSKIRILEEKKTILEVQIDPLRTETEKLRSMVKKQSEELEAYQKGSLTQNQTASLLQEVKNLEEKLSNAQKSKSFFKEQWGKAVREIHRMRIEHQQAIEVQIKSSKEELKNLNLEEILSADSTALTNDQIMLGQIQKEIDVIKPTTSFMQKDIHEQMFTSINDIYTKTSHSSNKVTLQKSEEQDDRLRALIEERDSLLKTGSYTIDDSVIIKLNSEIRSLLMSG